MPRPRSLTPSYRVTRWQRFGNWYVGEAEPVPVLNRRMHANHADIVRKAGANARRLTGRDTL